MFDVYKVPPAYRLLVRPEAIAFRADFSCTADVFIFYLVFYFNREISEMRRPIGAKFCTVIKRRPGFVMPVENFGALFSNFFGAKNMQNLD